MNIFSSSLLPSAKAGCLVASYSHLLPTAFGSVLLPSPFAVLPPLSLLVLRLSGLLHLPVWWGMLAPALL